MKRLISLLLVLFLLASFTASCGSGEAQPPSASDMDSLTEAPAPDPIVLAANGSKNYTVIRPDEAGSDLIQLTLQFVKKINNLCGSALTQTSDLMMRGASAKPDAPELLVGDTNREESVTLRQRLDAAGGERFAILSTDAKVAVCGTDTWAVFQGLDYLLTAFAAEADGSTSICVPKNYEYLSDEIEPWVPDLMKARLSKQNIAFYTLEKVVKFTPYLTYCNLQGGGTDGEYAYYALIDSENLQGVIYKYDLSTWELVQRSEPLPTAHTNDITYDAKNHRLAISHCHDSESYLGVCFVDPDTLLFDSFKKISVQYRALDYLPSRDCYVLGAFGRYTTVDKDLKFVSDFASGNTKYTTQGLCCDENYVYDVRYLPGEDIQYVVIHSMNGAYYGECPLYGAPSEPENIFPCGDNYGTFIIGYNQVLAAHRVVMLPARWWTK